MRCAFIYPGPGSDISDIGKIAWLNTSHYRDQCLSHTPIFRFAMGRHMTAHELDSMQAWKMQGAPTKDIYRRPQRARSAGGGDGPNLATVRRRYAASPLGVEGWGPVAASAPSALRMCAR